MARASRLKVYRTAIGFHDAYVAASSQKAALAAWDTEKDLFARGLAEVVTDAELAAEPLASLGKVIKRARGDLAEHLAASPEVSSRRKPPPSRDAPVERKPRAAKGRGSPKARTKPPSREEVKRAEAALSDFALAAEKEQEDLARREEALRKERQAMTKRHRDESGALERRLAEAKARYAEALERWRVID